MAICGSNHCDLFVFTGLEECFKNYLAGAFYQSQVTNNLDTDRDMETEVNEPCFSDLEVEPKIRRLQ